MAVQTSKAPASKKGVFHVGIRSEWCKGCGICSDMCPKHVIGMDEVAGKAVVVQIAECIGCRLCEKRCPDFAVVVRQEGGEPVTEQDETES